MAPFPFSECDSDTEFVTFKLSSSGRRRKKGLAIASTTTMFGMQEQGDEMSIFHLPEFIRVDEPSGE